MSTTMTGGCQCGRIRYTAEVEPDEAYLCHCRMCQRATGGVSIAFVNVAQDRLDWLSAPDWYQSSPIAHRGFCSVCGTPLAFAFLDGGNVDLTVGSFDDPAPFRPVQQVGTESMLTAWLDVRHLPASTSAENPNLVRRWKEAGIDLPE